MGGLRGGSNLASWVVAGTLAFFLWVKPSQELRKGLYLLLRDDKPVPDYQETGLIYGNKNRTSGPEK